MMNFAFFHASGCADTIIRMYLRDARPRVPVVYDKALNAAKIHNIPFRW